MINIRMAIVASALLCYFDQQPKTNYLVPNEETAIKIAEAIWLPIYGSSINKSKPFKAVLTGDYWHVTGTIPKGYYEVNAKGDSVLHIFSGGVPSISISARTCEVVSVNHGK